MGWEVGFMVRDFGGVGVDIVGGALGDGDIVERALGVAEGGLRAVGKFAVLMCSNEACIGL